MCREEEEEEEVEENTIANQTTTNQDMRMRNSSMSDRILNQDMIMITDKESQILGNCKKEVEIMIFNIKEEPLKFKTRKTKIE